MPYPTVVTDSAATQDKVNQFRTYASQLPDPAQPQIDADVAAYNAHVAKLGDVTQPTTPSASPSAAAASTSTAAPSSTTTTTTGGSLRSRNLISNQFDYQTNGQLTAAEAASACGPTAALAFARYAGRNPTIGEALTMAKSYGWTPTLGMAGPNSEVSLLGQMGVTSQYNPGASAGAVAQEVQAGRPIILDTPNHYYAIDDYNPQTGQYHVGGSGLALRGGSEWMTWSQISAHGNGVRGSITMRSDVPSATSGYEHPAATTVPQLLGGGNVGQSDQSGAGQAAAGVLPGVGQAQPQAGSGALADGSGLPNSQGDLASNAGGAGGLVGQPDPTPNDDLKEFSAYASSLGDPGGTSSFGSNPEDASSPIDQARTQGQTGLPDFAGMASSALGSVGGLVSSMLPKPADQGFSLPSSSDAGSQSYNDMAGASSSPLPAFGANPEDATSPIEQARQNNTGFQLLPGPTPISGPINATGIPQGIQANLDRRSLAFTAPPSAEQQQALNVTGTDLFPMAGIEAEGAQLAKPLLEGVGTKIGQAVRNVALKQTPAEKTIASIEARIRKYQQLQEAGVAAGDGTIVTHYDQLLTDSQKDLATAQKRALRQVTGADAKRTLANPTPPSTPVQPPPTAGPVAGLEPIPDAQATARQAVQDARLPNGQRAPVWMRAAPHALDNAAVDLSLPANSPLLSRPSGALPSGRTPGALGTTSKPFTPEVAGAATERALAIPQKGFAQTVEDASGRFLRESYDRLYPLRELDRQAGLGPNVGSHATAQVFSGAIAAGEDAAQRYVMPIIKKLGPDGADLEKWWVLQQSRDVLAKFKDSKLPGNIDGIGGIQREEAVIQQRLGPERFAAVQGAADQLWKLNDELRLKPLEEAGILKPSQRAALRNENPHYLPFDRYVHSAEDPSNLLPRTSSNLSVSSSGIKARTAAGAVHALDQPMARWVSDIIQTPVVVSRNRAAKSIVDALKEAERATGQKLIVEAPESTAQAAKLGQQTVDRGTISYFDPKNPGVRMVANVPAIYATVAKGMEAETSNVLSKLAGALATPLRLGATGLDPSFMAVNAARDLQSAFFREGLTPTSPYYIAGLKAALARNTDFEAAAKAGALHSGLMETRKSTDAIKRAQQMQGIQVRNAQDALLLIPKLMAKVPEKILQANEVIEQAPRIGTFLKAQAQGAGPIEAAVRARDVTVDFDKSGNAMRVLNQAVPFLNARAQGGANFVRTLRDNPKQALLRAAPLIAPEVLFWLWNQRYASSKLIPPYEYDRSYIFQVGESTESQDPKNPKAPTQAIPIYLKIPKGDPSAVVTSPVTAMLQAAFQQGDRSAVELILHAAQSATQGLSPIDPSVNSALSTLTPPLMATSQQIAQNRNTFTGRDIVPQGELGRPASQQYDQSTSRTAVALGEQFHVSPRLIDFAIRNYAGGTGHNAEWLSDLALGALGYNPEAPGQAMKQPLTPIQQAATMPGVSRFLGAKNTAEQIQGAQSLNDAVTQTRDLLYQNPEIKRFGIGFQPVGTTITSEGAKIPLTQQEQSLYQTRLGQQIKTDVDDFTTKPVYQQYKTDALRKRALDSVISKARAKVAAQMLQDIGRDEIRQRVQRAS